MSSDSLSGADGKDGRMVALRVALCYSRANNTAISVYSTLFHLLQIYTAQRLTSNNKV